LSNTRENKPQKNINKKAEIRKKKREMTLKRKRAGSLDAGGGGGGGGGAPARKEVGKARKLLKEV
jgi:hypothetical protein